MKNDFKKIYDDKITKADKQYTKTEYEDEAEDDAADKAA